MGSSQLSDIEPLAGWASDVDFDSMFDDINAHMPCDETLEGTAPLCDIRDSGSAHSLSKPTPLHSHPQSATLAMPVAANLPSLSSSWLVGGTTNTRQSPIRL
jgi:hypothetical protein